MIPYVIKQGDYLTQLAHDLGFDQDAVWKDDKNADLRDKRPNPDILYPGDVLYVPEKEPAPSQMAQGSENSYSADVPTVKVTLVFSNADPPLANEAFTVEGLPVTSGTTDGDGMFEFDVPVIVREFTVTFTDKEYEYHVLVGHLDPATEESGIRSRLANLGYYRRAADDEDADALAGAVAEFQRVNGIEPTGTVDDATRDALVSVYGH